MNDLFLLFGVLGMVAIALICFGTYAVYGGFRADLCNAQPGKVFNFEYMQPLNGDSKRVLAKVIEKPYRFSDIELQRMNRVSSYRKHDPEFKRTNHIVT